MITYNGKRIAKLIDTNQDKTEIVRSLRGILPPDTSLEEAKEGRIAKQWITTMETIYLNSIPGMAESIWKAAEEPLETGVPAEALDWIE